VRVGIFVQVRLGSTRLRRKALLPLAGGNVIEHVMRAIAGVPADVRALLTDVHSVEALRPFAETEGYDVYPGPAEDVLARYCGACREYDVSRVVRVTGDNPLTSAALAMDILSLHALRRPDLSHYLGIPWGIGVEVVEADALFKAERDAALPEEREHITTFLYRNRARFAILEPQAPARVFLPEARLTVDTQEDYEWVKMIFTALYKGAPIGAEEVVSWISRSSRGARGV
jgi:spore coat polysaccharide biosynthesis protein SpsF